MSDITAMASQVYNKSSLSECIRIYRHKGIDVTVTSFTGYD